MLFHKCCRCRTYSGIFINKQNVMNTFIHNMNAAETEMCTALHVILMMMRFYNQFFKALVSINQSKSKVYRQKNINFLM